MFKFGGIGALLGGWLSPQKPPVETGLLPSRTNRRFEESTTAQTLWIHSVKDANLWQEQLIAQMF